MQIYSTLQGNNRLLWFVWGDHKKVKDSNEEQVELYCPNQTCLKHELIN